MPTLVSPVSTPVARTTVAHDARAELEAASHRWVTSGESPETVAAYAHALRALIDDL